MSPLPLGLRIILVIVIFISTGMNGFFVFADYSIGTIIETTGPVRDSFTGLWSGSDENGTNITGVYSDSLMTNGGELTLNKHLSMTGKEAVSPVLQTQKIIGYSAGDTGYHLISDESIYTSTNILSNQSKGTLCFGNPYEVSQQSFKGQSASLSIVNAQELQLSSTARHIDGNLDYSLNIGNSGINSTDKYTEGTIITTFTGQSLTNTGEIKLYDRTLISGLIRTFNRLYQGSEDLNIMGSSSGEGFVHDKTIVEKYYTKNETDTSMVSSGTAVYYQDIMTNGGNTDEIRSTSGSESISSERMVAYTSDGDRSIQASEHAVATYLKGSEENSKDLSCVFAGSQSTNTTQSPYKEASAQTGFAGVSSAQISSSTLIRDPENSDALNLEYRADIMIPVGFNSTLMKEMKDPDNDGRFEDLNGNGRLDMHDLVLLFHNFRWIGESNLSLRIDFNKNGRADYADIVTVFHSMNQTQYL